MNLDPKGCDELRIAIIERANKDYRNAIKRHRKRRMIELEKIYRSEWGEFLTDGNGENIISRIRKEMNYGSI